LQPALRRFKADGNAWEVFPEKVFIQLNDTHPTLVVPDPAAVAAYAKVCGFVLHDHLPPTYPHVLAFPLHSLAALAFLVAVTVGIDGFAYAFASVVLITYMSTLASTDHAASQFGLLTSLCAFPGSVLAGFSGFAIEWTGFTWFFVATSLIGLPVALLAVFVWAKIGLSDEAKPGTIAAIHSPSRCRLIITTERDCRSRNAGSTGGNAGEGADAQTAVIAPMHPDRVGRG
jgi:hypothetical protein